MDTPEAAIKISDVAAGKLKELLAGQEDADQALRVAVAAAAAPASSTRSRSTSRRTDDHVFEHNGVAVVVDKVSMQFVFGSEVDYVEGLQGAGFAVNNPNVVAACGCGSSLPGQGRATRLAAAAPA